MILYSSYEHVLLDDKHPCNIVGIYNLVYACIQNYERFLDMWQEIVSHSSLIYLFKVLDVAWIKKDISNVFYLTAEDQRLVKLWE